MSKKEKKKREKFNVAKQQHNKKSNQTRSELYSVDPFERERDFIIIIIYVKRIVVSIVDLPKNNKTTILAILRFDIILLYREEINEFTYMYIYIDRV